VVDLVRRFGTRDAIEAVSLFGPFRELLKGSMPLSRVADAVGSPTLK